VAPQAQAGLADGLREGLPEDVTGDIVW